MHREGDGGDLITNCEFYCNEGNILYLRRSLTDLDGRILVEREPGKICVKLPQSDKARISRLWGHWGPVGHQINHQMASLLSLSNRPSHLAVLHGDQSQY